MTLKGRSEKWRRNHLSRGSSQKGEKSGGGNKHKIGWFDKTETGPLQQKNNNISGPEKPKRRHTTSGTARGGK